PRGEVDREAVRDGRDDEPPQQAPREEGELDREGEDAGPDEDPGARRAVQLTGALHGGARARWRRGAVRLGGGRGQCLAHQLAPENSDRREIIHRANMLTARVTAKSASPETKSVLRSTPKDSGKFSAMSPAMVPEAAE